MDKGEKKLKKIDITIFLLVLAVVAVLIVPRYSRYTKIGQTKSLIVQLEEAAMAVVQELHEKKVEAKKSNTILTDEQYLQILKKNLRGRIPVNPFTKSTDISLMHQRTISPGDIVDVKGGWIWKLVLPKEANQSVVCKFWLNSDTTHIGRGRGESHIQP